MISDLNMLDGLNGTTRKTINRGPRGTGNRGKASVSSPRGEKGASAKGKALKVCECWAKRYVLTAVAASALLNAYSAMEESKAVGAWRFVGVGMSAMMPGFVWLLYQLAGWQHRAGMKRLMYATIGVSTGILLLSLCHCSHAIEGLIGVPVGLAWGLAVGIDCGLVVAELTAIKCHD